MPEPIIPKQPPAPSFIAEADAFAERYRGHPALRLLGWFIGCAPGELDTLVRHLYCAALPASLLPSEGSPTQSLVKLLLLPFYYLVKKDWLWRRSAETDYILETIDPEYFRRWFAGIYRLLKGTKRIAPREGGIFPEEAEAKTTLPCPDSVRLSDVLRLALLLPAWIPVLADLTFRTGLNFFSQCRQAAAIFMVYSGFFRRYPCRHFITFDDMPNHPCRHLAFHRWSRGEFVVFQNAERGYLPQNAFGMMDRYFVFGTRYVDMMRTLRTEARIFEPLGSIFLDTYHELFLQDSRSGGPAAAHDILFIDQGVWPHNGVSREFDDALMRLLDNLAAFAGRHPDRRVCYQLRPYAKGPAAYKTAVLDCVRSRGKGLFHVLENDGQGESYRNILKTNLVITFESTLGFETLMMRRKALFVNYSSTPQESICPDPRFQLTDESADYARFEAKVLELLAMRLEAVPQAAMERHAFFDGKSAERVASALSAAFYPARDGRSL